MELISKHGSISEAGKEMGVNTWAAFAGTDDNALVDGDFVVLERELQPVLKSLRKSGINIVAIHHHMSGEVPRSKRLGRPGALRLSAGSIQGPRRKRHWT